MRYIGSKLRLIGFIEDVVKKYCGNDLGDKVFCDLFAGTGVVGRSFSPMVWEVIANDFEKYSFISNYVGLKGFDEEKVSGYLSEINRIKGTKDSSLYQAYAEGGSGGRLYFNEYNGMIIAAARKWLSENQDRMSFNDYMAVLLSIIDGADKVANTMSTYGAYAKKLKSNSLKDIEFVLPKKSEKASEFNSVFMCDSNELIKEIKGDILYLDPPYNNRQYGSNYHVLNAIAVGEAPDSDSVTGVKKDSYNKSDYCREKTVGAALDELLSNAEFEWIFLSYNNEGLLPFEDIREIMSKYGDYFVEGTEYQRYKADNNREQAADGVVEYIHVLHKGHFNGGMDDGDVSEKISMADSCAKGPSFLMSRISEAGGKPSETAEDSVTEDIEEKPEPEDNLISRWKEKLSNTVHVKVNSSIDNIATKFTVTSEGEVKFNGDDKIVVSPMNYMGGKKKLIKTLKEYFPKDIKVFMDLFCGGATVGINSDAEWVIFNDNITPLIEMYKYMKKHTVGTCLSYIDETIEKWHLVQGEEGKAAYYAFRDDHYNATPVEQRHPLDLFVLMAFSFNNQIRFAVNKNWKFNIPFGKDRSSFNPKMRENLIGFINALHKKNCFFLSCDFKDAPVSKDSFVYADPPYLISQATYNDGWDEESERALLDKLKSLDSEGGRFALSNVLENKGETNEILKNWAEENGYKIIHLDKSYANSYYHRKEKASKTDEVLIINY